MIVLKTPYLALDNLTHFVTVLMYVNYNTFVSTK